MDEKIIVSRSTAMMLSEFAGMMGGRLEAVCEALKKSIVASNQTDVLSDLEKIRQFTLKHGDITFKSMEGDQDHVFMVPAQEDNFIH